LSSYPVASLPIVPFPLSSSSPVAILFVITIIVNFVARRAVAILVVIISRRAVAIVVVVVIVTCRHRRCRRIPLPSLLSSYPFTPLPVAPSPVAIVVVVAIIVNFVARSAIAIVVVVVVVVTCRHRRRRPIPSRRRPSRRRHQPSPAAVLSITFAAPVDGRVLRSLPAQQHTN
jgi:hypothetical protein